MRHVNLSSFAGGGKTTIAKLLMEKYGAVLIPKFTTRPIRNSDKIPEYIYLTKEEFNSKNASGCFLAVENVDLNGEIHQHAIPKIDFWKIPRGSDLVISIFGEKANLAKLYVPELKLVFISFKDKNILRNRLLHRCEEDGGNNFEKKWALNERYFSSHIEELYDCVVYNDSLPEDCVSQIMQLL